MTHQSTTRLRLVCTAAVLLLAHLMLVLPDPCPSVVLWLPGKIAAWVARDVLHDPGTHGFGYFNPALLLVAFYFVNVIVSVAAGFALSSVITSFHTRRASSSFDPR